MICPSIRFGQTSWHQIHKIAFIVSGHFDVQTPNLNLIQSWGYWLHVIVSNTCDYHNSTHSCVNHQASNGVQRWKCNLQLTEIQLTDHLSLHLSYEVLQEFSRVPARRRRIHDRMANVPYTLVLKKQISLKFRDISLIWIIRILSIRIIRIIWITWTWCNPLFGYFPWSLRYRLPIWSMVWLWRGSWNRSTIRILIIKNVLTCIIFPFFKIDFQWKTSHSVWCHDAYIVLISNTTLRIGWTEISLFMFNFIGIGLRNTNHTANIRKRS